MSRYIRFIVTTDHDSKTACTGVVASLRILGEDGNLPDYYLESSTEIFDEMNRDLTCPPWHDAKLDSGCVSWFKDTAGGQHWIGKFREIVAILEDAGVEVATLTTERPGMIVYEDEFQVVAKSGLY